jgi:hypothetical protein
LRQIKAWPPNESVAALLSFKMCRPNIFCAISFDFCLPKVIVISSENGNKYGDIIADVFCHQFKFIHRPMLIKSRNQNPYPSSSSAKVDLSSFAHF